MSNIAIKVQGLGKKYTISHQRQAGHKNYVALRDVLTEAASSSIRKLRTIAGRTKTSQTPITNASRETFWAVRDVSFEVEQGSAIGIIGRNGAGKSTLLKLLSRITEPSTGFIELNGRVASLLEVGTGFHPELTGRENIYLNGAILGMTRKEIRRKFEEIVDFAEVEKFLDTPVKRYSSGMYVRLAFAVAAHLEPEILVVDEVLAVGDIDFQKKCLGKMQSVSKDGRTVLFVSHNMDAVAKLCSKALILTKGTSGEIKDVEDAIRDYTGQAESQIATFESETATRPLQRVILDEDALHNETLRISIEYAFSATICSPTFGFVLYTESGVPIFGSNTMYHPPQKRIANKTKGIATVEMNNLPLWSGEYYISIWLSDSLSPIDYQERAIVLQFMSRSAPINAPSPKHIGPIHLPAIWTY